MIGNVLREIRESSNLTRTDLASRINVSYSALDHWENNRRDISIYNLMSILKIFKCNMILKDGSLTIEELKTNKTYEIDFSRLESNNVLYSYEGYGIIKNDDDYSVINLKTLTTPCRLSLGYKSIADAKYELHKFIREDRFPILTSVTDSTYGRLIFKEQIEEILTYIGCENSLDVIKGVGMKKQINIAPIRDGCIFKYGENDGRELLDLILSSVSTSFKKSIMDEVIVGYEGFLQATTRLTEGFLKKPHQKHALLSLIDNNNQYNYSTFKEYSEYDEAIVSIISEPIYKYGYPTFYKRVIESLNI